MNEEDRWYTENEERRHRDLEAEEAERERATERLYDKGGLPERPKKEARDGHTG